MWEDIKQMLGDTNNCWRYYQMWANINNVGDINNSGRDYTTVDHIDEVKKKQNP
ncbi:hypothetical protein PFDG_05035 [Plasmodium falciparum Dd2]|uniref:Uncharacterized protein n=1 Tax=Plasmodium falciparum (isolate Dd2) TaxID=57267 RepID=A0A0L7M9I8_PLAF4|nr:hypothetical protein PFDG_05035 [Plasmodium falciparum Dd2]